MKTLLLLFVAVSASTRSKVPQKDVAPPPSAQSQPVSSGPALPVLTIDQAIEEVVVNNPDYKVAKSRLDQAKGVTRQVWAGYLPQLSAGGSYTWNSVEARISQPTVYRVIDPITGAPYSPANTVPPPSVLIAAPDPNSLIEVVIQQRNQLNGQAQLSQAVIAPALWPAIRNAYLSENVASIGIENARTELVFTTMQLYYGAAALKEAVEVQRRILQVNLAHEKDAQLRYDTGAVAKVALLRAQIDRAKSEQDVKRAENAYQSAKSSLAMVLAREPDFEIARPGAPEALTAPLPKEDLEARPDLKMSRAQLKLADGQRSGVLYSYAPTVGVAGKYSISNARGFTGRYDLWQVVASVNWNIWDGGAREGQYKTNAALAAQASYNLETAENRSRDEMRRAALDLDSARANYAKAEEQMRLARENAALIQVNFNAGAATYLEVADANTALQSAELTFISEQLNTGLAWLRYKKSAGLFHP